MTPAAREWLSGLRAFAADERARRPPPLGHDKARIAEQSILAAHLVSWLTDWNAWQPAREAWAAAGGGDPEPVVVLTTSSAGLAATADVLGSSGPLGVALAARAAAVTEREYRLWCIRCPDAGQRLHMNHWNWIKTRVPEARTAEFARFPLGPGECYWLHRTGTAGAGTADRRGCGLWKWTGRQAVLLDPRIEERGVSHLDDPGPPGP